MATPPLPSGYPAESVLTMLRYLGGSAVPFGDLVRHGYHLLGFVLGQLYPAGSEPSVFQLRLPEPSLTAGEMTDSLTSLKSAFEAPQGDPQAQVQLDWRALLRTILQLLQGLV